MNKAQLDGIRQMAGVLDHSTIMSEAYWQAKRDAAKTAAERFAITQAYIAWYTSK